MTEEAGPGGEELSPTDAAILEMIREGRYDAEIASRLYITTADVKARIERMLAQGGLRERSDFITPPVPEPEDSEEEAAAFERQPRTMSVHNAVLAVFGALAIWAGVGWVVRDAQQDGPQRGDVQSAVRTAESHPDAESDSFSSTDQDLLFRILSSGSVRIVGGSSTPGAAAWDLGSLFTPEATASSVDSLSYDGNGRRVVQLIGPSLIETAGPTTWTVERRTTGQMTLITRVLDRTIVLRLETLDETTRFEREGATLRVSTDDGSHPRFQLWVDGAVWTFGLDGRLVVYL